jgi:hypothetical protein
MNQGGRGRQDAESAKKKTITDEDHLLAERDKWGGIPKGITLMEKEKGGWLVEVD